MVWAGCVTPLLCGNEALLTKSFLWIYSHKTNNAEKLCAKTVQYLCIIIIIIVITAMTLYVSFTVVIYVRGQNAK